ncbi:MAG: hypothetical protein GX755_00670 [Syntrophomonadaceae bacterium]|nr:hypothetical protein [Syntrophomonadaceae bacterium]
MFWFVLFMCEASRWLVILSCNLVALALAFPRLIDLFSCGIAAMPTGPVSFQVYGSIWVYLF